MCYWFVQSLENLAATKIASILWSQADVRALIVKINEVNEDFLDPCSLPSKDIDGWQEVEQEVIHKVLLLSQPAPLKKKTLSVVRPIGLQILKWKVHTEKLCRIQFRIENFPKEFFWTSWGTIKKRKMADALVAEFTLTEMDRFRLACLHCMENGTLPLNLAEEMDAHRAWSDGYVAYWAYSRKGKGAVIDKMTRYMRSSSKSSNQFAFRWANIFSCREMIEYYFHRLTPREKEESLSDITLGTSFADFDLYRFLLQQMNEQQQSKLLEENAVAVATSLLDWPYQVLFLDLTYRVRVILDGSDYYSLLSRIVDKIEDGYQDYNYRALFKKFWLQIPEAQRKHTLRECDDGFGQFLEKLFQVLDVETVSLLLKDLTAEEKENMIFDPDNGIHTCAVLAEHDQWDSLKLLIGECVRSRVKMIKLKNACEKSGLFSSAFSKKFFKFMDELIKECSRERDAGEALSCA